MKCSSLPPKIKIPSPKFYSTTMQSELFPGADYRQCFPADDFDGLGVFQRYEFPNFPPPPVPVFNSLCESSSSLDLKRRFETTTTSEVMEDDKAIVALRNHKEAEKRRRERINSHLHRLRSLLPCTSKTDKATLLAKVVERVKELSNEASEIMKSGKTMIPCEKDEISVNAEMEDELMMRTSVSCEERSELFSELSRVVKSLNLKTVKAEICTVGGRARSVLVVRGERCSGQQNAAFLYDALKGIVQPSSGSGDGFKRRRRMDLQPHLA